MATYLNDINNLINDRRRDTTSNSLDITNAGFRAINTTLQIWNDTHDWEWQITKSILNYNEGITRYSLNANHKAPIDLRFYRNPRTREFDMVSESSFDSETLKTNRFAIETLNRTAYLRIKTSGNKAQIHTLGSINDGTWTASGAVSGLSNNSNEFFDLSSSVEFAFSGTATGSVLISLASQLDISSYRNRSGIYFNANFESWTNWTSFILRVGNDSSNYWTATFTTDYLANTPTDAQWNTFGDQWSNFTPVGSPTAVAIDYVLLTINYSADPSLNSCFLENLFVSENVPLLYEYYSNEMVQATATATKTSVFASSTAVYDFPLWSGKWDTMTPAFIDSCLDSIFFITGEIDDFNIVQQKIKDRVGLLRARYPSRRRYPEFSMKFDVV